VRAPIVIAGGCGCQLINQAERTALRAPLFGAALAATAA